MDLEQCFALTYMQAREKFLSAARSRDAKVHDLHMLQSVLSLPDHLDVFEGGIASRVDFSFSGRRGAR